VPFTLDIPSDASPAFELVDSSTGSDATSGLEWKLNVVLQVGIPPLQEEVLSKGKNQKRNLVKDGSQSEWGFCYTASDDAVPLERVGKTDQSNVQRSMGWMSYLAPGYFLKSAEGSKEERTEGSEGESEGEPVRWKGKGKEGEIGQDGLGELSEWRRLIGENVEFEVPLRVWPGNTAFRPTDVVFEV
jgi:hypothetical protein